MTFDPPFFAVHDAVRLALVEDLVPLGDLTVSLLDDDVVGAADFVSRETGVVAGAACVDETFGQVSRDLEIVWERRDGDRVEPGDVIARARGPLADLLTAERTALNFLCMLSGIATRTRAFVDAAAGGAIVWDTRKTTPGLRSLQKAAVRAGGGANHRGNLSDWIMIKDNHLAGLSIAEAVARARSMWPGRTVHVECDRPEQLEQAIEARADAVLLDNMSPDQVRTCVARIREASGDMLVEASGGISLDTIGEYARTGVDCISTSRITQSAPALDIGLDLAVEPR